MPNVDMWEPEDPRKIYNELIKRCKEAKEWCVACLVAEAWVPADKFPLEYFIADGVYYFRVIATTHRESVMNVLEFVPVIKILDLDNDEQ